MSDGNLASHHLQTPNVATCCFPTTRLIMPRDDRTLFCSQRVPPMVHHGRQVPLLLLDLEVVIGLAHHGRLLD